VFLFALLFCYLFTYFNSDLVFANITDYLFNSNGHHSVNFSLLFSPTVFLFALLFCFLLNLLSSIIPAWQASRTNIVNALNGRTR
jgi:putative ABC transport system permease protein